MTQTSQPLVVTVTGSNGSATGTADSARPYSGRVVGFYVKYTTQGAGCVVTITTKGQNAPSYTLFVTAAGNTSGYFAPQTPTVKTTDGSAITAWYVDMHVDDIITAAVASSNAGTVTVWMLYEGTD